MYLKSIEAQGFKSFYSKTVLDFSKGITGIVGPNGSGKSNISDAVRWVLGEQKVKQLRGASMQDVIFAGTQTRKPCSYAYVAITLDNSDRSLQIAYDEVTVTRRLYRSGESEYMLNGTECRLKDINELFYDTGIGKEGYSIIGQGQIDRILSGKPEERRALFDEAVGIVKFKRRKEVSQKKLEAEQQNLQRVTDVLKELERQVGPLKEQAEHAREYLSCRDQLLIYDSNIFVREMDQNMEGLAKLEDNESLLQEELAEARKASEKLGREYEELEEKIRVLDQGLQEARDEAGKADLLSTNLTGQINVLNEQISTEKNNALHYGQRINALSKELFSCIKEIEDNLSVIRFIRDQITFIKTNGAGDVEKENIDIDLQLIEGAARETEKTVAACMGEDFQLEIRPVGDAEKSLDGHSDGFLRDIEKKRSELREIQDKLAAHQENMRKMQQEAEDGRARFARIQDSLQQKTRERDNLKNRLETLRNLAERYEGYGNAVKMVMDRRERVRGIEGVVSDLIEVPKKYEVAIETALGGAVQNIVTRDEMTAKDMIQFLKQNRYGRATFLPLSNIRGRKDENCEKAAREAGAVGIGCDLVQCSGEYQTLAVYLLGRVLVVDNIDHALAIQRKYRQGLRIVTLEGELLNPGGSISGGAYRNSSNLMGRKRELEELEAGILASEESLGKLKEEGRRAQEVLAEKDRQLEEARKTLNQMELEKNTKALNISSDINVEYSSLSTRTDFVTENLHRLNAQLEKVFEEKGSIEDSQHDSDQVLAEKQRKIGELNELIENAGKAREELEQKAGVMEEEKQGLLAKRKSFFGKKDELSEKLLAMEKESMHVQNRKEKFEQRMETLTSYMLEEYNLTYQAAKDKFSDEFANLQELKKLAGEMKGRIRKLGPVNVNAIEQYKEISGRYEFLNNQYQDLVSSEEKLQKIILDLDRGMRKQFNENFALIRLKFDEVFKVLFGGGQGRIEMDEGDVDVLSAGIHIIAEPPGKKLQNMMQLSGGEKALTAISLLFAIQSMKPSPFCLLDEIEAALDDSNVARFADYLQNLTEHTQFIVITHRRGTMERADRLFGITMQEKGISALVSVDLQKDQFVQGAS